MMMIRCLSLCLLFAAVCPAEEYSYWIEACAPEAAKATTCEAGDVELAQWALEAWQRESGGAVTFHKSASEEHARIRLRWANGTSSLYGETQAVMVDGRPGSVIYVLPSVALPPSEPGGADRLMRDAVVYLTCLHESGHALGMRHTAAFADIMYSFQYGGDIPAYFQRYRQLLKKRADIKQHSGISETDRAVIRGSK